MKIEIKKIVVHKNRLRRAFTLVEMLLVVTIIGILAALVIPRIVGASERSRVQAAVFRREDESIAAFAVDHPGGIAVVEAAILIETGSYSRFDKMILVVCAEQQQVERALRREGALESDIRARISRQMPLAEKRKYADFVIDTSGEKQDTLRQTRAVYDVLRRIQS